MLVPTCLRCPSSHLWLRTRELVVPPLTAPFHQPPPITVVAAIIESHKSLSNADLLLPIWYRLPAGCEDRPADGNHGRSAVFKRLRRIPTKTTPAAHKYLYCRHLRRHQHCLLAGRGLLSMVGWVKTIFVPLACNPPRSPPTSPTRFLRV